MQKMTNVFIVNISMRKMILEVEYSKSMIYEILKIFRRITYFMILRHLFCFKDGSSLKDTKKKGLVIFNSLKQRNQFLTS